MPSIFLSHNSRDKFFVRELAKRLESYGIKVWIDEAEINVGDSLTEKIGDAIDKTDFFGVVLSHNSIDSDWVQRELQIAIQKEFSGKRVVVLPILLEPVEVPPFLRDKLYADFTAPDKFEETFPRLLRALGVAKEKAIPVVKRVVEPVPKAILSTSERRLATFEDIRIVSLDDHKSYKPDPQKLLYNIYLKLSGAPPAEWQDIFEAERRFPRHSMWRRAWVEGDYITIHCVPEELEKYHLQDLQEDVVNANNKYRQYLTELVRREIKEAEKEYNERDQLKELKRKLKLD